jgi:hypothetical protein
VRVSSRNRSIFALSGCSHHLEKIPVTVRDWILGVGLGIALNYIGILKLIDWLKDEQTAYIFPQRCLPPAAKKERLS